MRFILKRKLLLNDFDNFNMNYYMTNKCKVYIHMEMSDKYLSKINYKCPQVINLQNTCCVVKLRAHKHHTLPR